MDIVVAEQKTCPKFLTISNKVGVWEVITNAAKLDNDGVCEFQGKMKGMFS